MWSKLSLTGATVILLVGCNAVTSTKSTTPSEPAVSSAIVNYDNKEHLLDGTTIDWSYTSSGSGMILSFESGLAQYEWVTGARKGRKAQDIPYKSRKIGDDVYLVNWVQPEKPDFITLIFDFKRNVAFSSGLIGYGTDRQKNLFLDGVVNSVKR